MLCARAGNRLSEGPQLGGRRHALAHLRLGGSQSTELDVHRAREGQRSRVGCSVLEGQKNDGCIAALPLPAKASATRLGARLGLRPEETLSRCSGRQGRIVAARAPREASPSRLRLASMVRALAITRGDDPGAADASMVDNSVEIEFYSRERPGRRGAAHAEAEGASGSESLPPAAPNASAKTSCILRVNPVSVTDRRGPNVLGVETWSPWYELATLGRRRSVGTVTESGKSVGIEGKVSLEKLSAVTVRRVGERKAGGKGEGNEGIVRVAASDRASTFATTATSSSVSSLSSPSSSSTRDVALVSTLDNRLDRERSDVGREGKTSGTRIWMPDGDRMKAGSVASSSGANVGPSAVRGDRGSSERNELCDQMEAVALLRCGSDGLETIEDDDGAVGEAKPGVRTSSKKAHGRSRVREAETGERGEGKGSSKSMGRVPDVSNREGRGDEYSGRAKESSRGVKAKDDRGPALAWPRGVKDDRRRPVTEARCNPSVTSSRSTTLLRLLPGVVSRATTAVLDPLARRARSSLDRRRPQVGRRRSSEVGDVVGAALLPTLAKGETNSMTRTDSPVALSAERFPGAGARGRDLSDAMDEGTSGRTRPRRLGLNSCR